MNLENLSADLAARIPEMSRDSAINNAKTIKGIIQQYQRKDVPEESASMKSDTLAFKLTIASIACITLAFISVVVVAGLHLNKPNQPPPTPVVETNRQSHLPSH